MKENEKRRDNDPRGANYMPNDNIAEWYEGHRTRSDGWILLGRIAVDSAQLMIADPSYYAMAALEGHLRHFDHLAAKDIPWYPHGVFRENGSLITSAIFFPTGLGDGRYPVEGRFEDSGLGRRLAEVRIRFIDSTGGDEIGRAT